MKRTDCKKGMKLRKVEVLEGQYIEKGEIVEVEKITEDNEVWAYSANGEKFIIEPKFFEPAKSKFENGAKILYKTDMETFKARVWGSTYNSAGYYDYAIEVNNLWHTLAEEKELFPRKTADSLEEGDRFRDVFDNIIEVRGVAFSKAVNHNRYLGENNYGYIRIYDPGDVGEIVYEGDKDEMVR